MEQQQRQEVMTLQQKEQFDHLLREQQKLLVKQQHEAEEQIDALRDDLMEMEILIWK